MENVFVVLIEYPYEGDSSEIKIFAKEKVAREFVFESIKRYYKDTPTLTQEREEGGEEDSDHPAEWRLHVSEGIAAVEADPNDEEAFDQLLEDFDALGRQFTTFTIYEEKVHTEA